jgi:hypothetical protein
VAYFIAKWEQSLIIPDSFPIGGALKRLLVLLIIPMVLLAVPVASGASTKTPEVFDGSYTIHSTVFTTTKDCPSDFPTPTPSATKVVHLVVSGGAIGGHAIHFVLSSTSSGTLAVVVNAGGSTGTTKYLFSLDFGGATVIGTSSSKLVDIPDAAGCTVNSRGTFRGSRTSK